MFSGGHAASSNSSAPPVDLTPEKVRRLWEEWKETYQTERGKSADVNPAIRVDGRDVELFNPRGDGWEAYSRKIFTESAWWITVQILKFGDDYRIYFFGSNGKLRAKAIVPHKSACCVGERSQTVGELSFSSAQNPCPAPVRVWDKIWPPEAHDGTDYPIFKFLDKESAAQLYWIEFAIEAVSGENFSLVSEKSREARHIQWLAWVVSDPSRDARERVNAARQLGEMGAKAEAAAIPLCRILGYYTSPEISVVPNDADWILRATAEALGKIGRGDNVSSGYIANALMSLLFKRSNDYDESAHHALVQIVRNMWNDPDRGTRASIALALRNADVRLRRFTIRVLADSGIAEVHPLLIEALHDSDPEVQRVARDALQKL